MGAGAVGTVTGREGAAHAALTGGGGRLTGRAERVGEQREEHEEGGTGEQDPTGHVAEHVGARAGDRPRRSRGWGCSALGAGGGRCRQTADGDVARPEGGHVEASRSAVERTRPAVGWGGRDATRAVVAGRRLVLEVDHHRSRARSGEHGLEAVRAVDLLDEDDAVRRDRAAGIRPRLADGQEIERPGAVGAQVPGAFARAQS